MAKAIEDALAGLMGPLPAAPPAKLVTDRRALFIAIAEGVISHLKQQGGGVRRSPCDIGLINVHVHTRTST